MLKLRIALVVGLVAAVSATAARAQPAERPVVEPWIELTLQNIASHTVNPPRASRALALVSVAAYEAVRADPNPSQREAVAGAESTVLAYLFPDRFRALPAAPAPADAGGFALGRRIGERLVARAKADGSDATWTGSIPTGPNFWVPTPPAFVQTPLEPLAGTWRTWNLDSGSQFRPGPPPLPGSARFEAELNDVYTMSLTLTDRERAIAKYWADGAGTVTPPGHWNRIALDLLAAHPRSVLETARLFALLNTAQADAFIACWDAKYTYWSLRPLTAIRRLFDPAWLSYIVTPPFPSYVSGHATTSGAASTVLVSFFPGEAAQLRGWAEEAAMSRLYGGIHFASDNEAGLVLGRQVGGAALAHPGSWASERTNH